MRFFLYSLRIGFTIFFFVLRLPGFTWLLCFCMGGPAVSMIFYNPQFRPGCSIYIDALSNGYAQAIIDDPGFNFILSYIIISYIIAGLFLIIFLGLTCFHKMADKRFRTYVKMLTCLVIVWIVSR